VWLIGESRVRGGVREGPRPVDLVARMLEPPHQVITMRARPEHDPELAREIVAREAGDRLELTRRHRASSLRIEELPRPLYRADVDPPRDRGTRARAFGGQQALRQLDHERVDGQRVQRRAESLRDRAR
jgi:hypothetical protein